MQVTYTAVFYAQDTDVGKCARGRYCCRNINPPCKQGAVDTYT